MNTLKFVAAVCVILAFAAAAPLVTLASYGCASRITTNQLGDGNTYSCYLAGESANYCYYECGSA